MPTFFQISIKFFPRSIDFYNPKQISSLGHNYGSTRMSAEAMGSGGYTIPLEEYRYGFSMLGVYGVNLFIPHLFHYSMDRPENQNDWPPSWFYQNPYWKYFKPLANYAQRISYMIAQGKHVAKVAIVYPLTQVWLGGYTAPVSDELYREVQQQLLDNHIDYDVIDPYTLSNAKSNKNGLLVGNEQYQALVLPGLKAIQTACLNKINDFVLNGGVVIGINELPTNSEKGTPIDPFVVGSMQKIFGFQPRELLQIQYHTINDNHDNRILIHSVPGGGKGIFSRYTEDLTTFMVLQSKYGNEKVQFIGIALDDVAAVKVFQEKTGVNYPLLIAGDWAGFALAKKMGNIMSAIPYTVVVNSAGMIIYRHMGELSASELNSVVEPLL